MKIKIIIRDQNCNLNICILCDPYQLVKKDHIYFFLRVYKNLEINVCNIYIEQFFWINSDYIFYFYFLGDGDRNLHMKICCMCPMNLKISYAYLSLWMEICCCNMREWHMRQTEERSWASILWFKHSTTQRTNFWEFKNFTQSSATSWSSFEVIT